jgi:hypothetical protein
MRWAGHVACMGEKMNPYRILVGKPEGKMPLARPRRKWVDNIKINLRLEGLVWTGFIWLRRGYQLRALVNTVMKFRVSYVGKLLSKQLAASQEMLSSMKLVILLLK